TPEAGHRDESAGSSRLPSLAGFAGETPGGSETTRRPPTHRKGELHSAVMAGRPKLLATTKGNWPRRPGSLPASSALAHSTIARGARPSSATVSLRNSVRLWLLSKD